MQSKTSAFLKVLINRFHPGINPAFLKSLPSEEVKGAFAEITSSQDISIPFSWPIKLISRTHYSWLAPHLEKFPKNIQSLIINALPEAQAKGLKNGIRVHH